MTQDPDEQVDTDISDSNPNAAGREGLRGDMGISSERTGPQGDNPADSGVQGTGSHGTAAADTDGVSNTSRASHDEPGGPGGSAPGNQGPEMDETQQRATQEWRDNLPEADEDEPPPGPGTGIDRTAGEANTAEVPSQQNDPRKNPGHSHG
jgi:hypothetical protein